MRNPEDNTAKREKDQTIVIDINNEFDEKATYATLCHELAHVYLGHLGCVGTETWPDRNFLPKDLMELEAESCSFLVCNRFGLKTRSEEYVAGHVEAESAFRQVSIDLVVKVASLLEKMAFQDIKKTKKVATKK